MTQLQITVTNSCLMHVVRLRSYWDTRFSVLAQRENINTKYRLDLADTAHLLHS